MRAQMRALAAVHATSFAFLDEMGGKETFLKRHECIREKRLPRLSVIKVG